MTNDQIRIAIAEASGWKFQKGEDPCYGEQYKLQGWFTPSGRFEFDIPNFPECLNACHDMEKTLSVNQWDEYLDTLYKISQDPHICPSSHAMAYVGATAQHRCIAFLRTKGLWTE